MGIRSLAKNLPPDPAKEGWVLGWGVLRDRHPWHFVDVYADQKTAKAEAERLGDGYVVEYGSHRLGSKEFVCGSTLPEG
ncbi:hypothetical protein OGV25_09425 [Pseudomonas sp. P1B16]|jgi:hypothetical protein|uniref:Uncharacterized protein n=1 Tax=Pseudomonas capeferrum TaxID=1495066 RepID=A0ABY7REY7_9PSED|nr:MULTISPECIES: hypothetical protein [Pseudomonas]KEY87846.1 hypothetical protein PC358_01670 [Pseudomonas capeferrum]KGI94362.1 hypothetical protein MD26_05520 [Pseudomonas sp. H2]MCH7300901.1 hypothetical protein [Pseudomonas capeferrum]MDD2062923.1 hypothetical protein [Pseudomonas sp. 25571]MDD2129819.1 hypothetical protein [Pseudomonas sp. 17391]